MLEAQFVASLIRHPVLAKAIVLAPEHFHHPKNAALFRALREMTVDVSPLTIADQMYKQNGVPFDVDYLTAVMDLEADIRTIEEFQERANKIHDSFLRLDAKSKITGKLASFIDPQIPLQTTLAEVNTIILAATGEQLGRADPSVAAIIQRSYDSETNQSFPCGIAGIDGALTAQGMKKKSIWSVAAGYAQFKTTITLNIIDNLLQQGLSVAYVALEDSDTVYSEVLTAIHSGVPLYVIEDLHTTGKVPSRPEAQEALLEAERWLTEDVGSRFRVYDAPYGVHDPKKFASLVAADKVMYGTQVVILDYLQCWAEAPEELSKVMQMLVRVAGEQDVCLFILNQLSNESLKFGTHSSIFSAKGSSSIGAAVHVGFEARHDHETGRTRVTHKLLEEIDATGRKHFLSMAGGPRIQGHPAPSEVVEVEIALKKLRRGRRGKTVLLIDPLSGRIVLEYPSLRFMKESVNS
jgi:KaiC/GvpD/RAD55 family RecA-like ATPase